jgi:carbamoyltransferase
MLKAYQVKNDKKEIIAGVIHVDGSSRPQTVTENTNAVYYRMLNKFYKEKSIPMVLNTSFNLRGEPMVLTPYDAIRTFFTSALDLLVINDLIVYK